MYTFAERAKVARQALRKKYGAKNVRVEKGRGTACHWIEVRLNDAVDIDAREAERVATEAIEREGMKLSTYLTDDGIGMDRNCILVQKRTF